MKVTLTRNGASAFARIVSPVREISVLLHEGMTAGQSMRQTAKEMREQAAEKLKRAQIIEDASFLF